MRFVYRDQFLVFDPEIFPPPAPAAAVPRITPFLDVDQGHFHAEALVWKDASEMHHFMEQIEDRSAFGAPPPVDNGAVLLARLTSVFCTMIGLTTTT